MNDKEQMAEVQIFWPFLGSEVSKTSLIQAAVLIRAIPVEYVSQGGATQQWGLASPGLEVVWSYGE